MRLDPRTVMILIIVGSSLMGIGLLGAMRGRLGEIRGGSFWAKATLTQAAGWTLVGPLRGVMPDLIWVVMGHGLLALSLALYLSVLAEFRDRRLGPFWTYGVVVVQTALLTGLVLSGASPGARTVVVAAGSAALMLKGGYLLLSNRESRLPSHGFTGMMFATCGAMMIARSLYELLWLVGPGRAPVSVEVMANDLTYLVFYVTATLLTFGFVLMVSDRYMARREEGEMALHRNIARQEQVETSLQAALGEKEALLQEVHHRVKNNLALIASLMRLEAGQHKDPGTQAVANRMQSRIRSVVLLNQTLYKAASYSTVDLATYLSQVATQLFNAQNADPAGVRLVLDLAPAHVITRQAIPCGLIVNELVTNSLKHAFPAGGSGEVRVGLWRDADGLVRIRVSDTGRGLSPDFASNRGESLGLQLVSDLAKQLQGSLDVGPGAMFTITFTPLLDDADRDRPSGGIAREPIPSKA